MPASFCWNEPNVYLKNGLINEIESSRRCLIDEAEERITARAALAHNLFLFDLKPTVRDMVILPSNVLRLIDILGEDTQYTQEELDGNSSISFFFLIFFFSNLFLFFASFAFNPTTYNCNVFSFFS